MDFLKTAIDSLGDSIADFVRQAFTAIASFARGDVAHAGPYLPAVFLFLVLLVIVIVLRLITSAPPKIAAPRDVFGFAAMALRDESPLPEVQYYPGRDGGKLAVRIYPSQAVSTLIFLHGSSYHGGGYHSLATHIAEQGLARVVMPNLRGHMLSGVRRGDVDHFNQLEDDFADLVAWLRHEDGCGPVMLGGHSSGAGLAIRIAGGEHRHLVTGFLLLAPIMPLSEAMRGGDAGGWALLYKKRLAGLLIANAFGLHGLDGTPVITFNKPATLCNGSETLTYSHRLNTAYHPRFRYQRDLAAIAPRAQVLIGEDDQAIDALKLHKLVSRVAPAAQVEILSDTDHFGIFTQPKAFAAIGNALRALSS